MALAKIGVLVAATGAAHFIVPDVFKQITAPYFPEDTAQWVQRNGATELGLGFALVLKPTRKLGFLGLLGYLGFLGSRIAASRSIVR
jgi:uncharacterized membrane protein